MEVFLLLFYDLFQEILRFFPTNPKKWANGWADAAQIQGKGSKKSRPFPYAEATAAERHAEQEQRRRAGQAEKHIAEDPSQLSRNRADLSEDVVEQSCRKAENGGGCNGYRLCADGNAHLPHPNRRDHSDPPLARSS